MAESIDTKAINDSLAALSKSIKDLVAANSIYARSLRDHTEVIENVDDQLSEFENSVSKNKTLNDTQRKLANEYIKAKKEENKILESVNKTQRQLAKLQQAGVQDSNVHARTQARLQTLQQAHLGAQAKTAIAQNSYVKAIGGLTSGMGTLGKVIAFASKGFNVLMLGLTLLSDRLDKTKQQMADNVGFVEDIGKTGNAWMAMQNQRMVALSNLIRPEEIGKISAQFRNIILAGGGLEKTLKVASAAQNDFYAMTGDLTAAAQLSLQALQDLATSGVWPTQQALRGYTDDVKALSASTGLAADRVMALYKEVADDVDSQILLKAARADEREAILASQRALIGMSRAAGMTAEQAAAAAKMLNRMVAAKPIERIKQAAKVRALSAAMGVGGGAEAAQALIAGPRATADQKQQLMQFNQNLTGVLDQARGSGFGAELFATTLTDKLGLEDYFGANSPFTTTLGEVNKEAAKNAKSQLDISNSQLIGILKTNDAIMLVANNVDNILEWLISKFGMTMMDVMKSTMAWLADSVVKPLKAWIGAMLQTIGSIPGLGKIGKIGENMINEAAAPASVPTPTTTQQIPLVSRQQQYEKQLQQLNQGKVEDNTASVAASSQTIAALQEKQATSLDRQLAKVDESNSSLKQIAVQTQQTNDLLQQLLKAFQDADEKERRASEVGERMGNLRGTTKQYKNVFY